MEREYRILSSSIFLSSLTTDKGSMLCFILGKELAESNQVVEHQSMCRKVRPLSWWDREHPLTFCGPFLVPSPREGVVVQGLLFYKDQKPRDLYKPLCLSVVKLL